MKTKRHSDNMNIHRKRKEDSFIGRRIHIFHWQLILCCWLLTFVCCQGGKHRKPTSTGQPYEVVVEGDSDSIITHILSGYTPHLPQPEPMFSIIQVRRGMTQGSYLLVRNRIVVDINAKHTGYAVKMRKDENASPQTIIYIQAQSAEQLRKHLDGYRLRDLLDQAELKHLSLVIQQSPEKQKELYQRFGIHMKIPASMIASKHDKDFTWLSNNANTGMQSLIAFRVKSHTPLQEQVDSALRRNMLGETDSMYMQLVDLSTDQRGTSHGLWQMHGDDMGGPYVMKKKDNVVIIGFVYAPEKKKRILIKQLEAALSTIK